MLLSWFFFFKQKTAYEMRISDWSSDVCSSDLHAIHAAITDCRNAGIDLERDPAVILLARHLGTVCETRAPDADLRRDCIARIAELRNRPALKTLAYRGVAHDEHAKRLFHSEGRPAMRRLADALALDEGSFDIGSNKGCPAVSCAVTLQGQHGGEQLAISLHAPDRA